MKYDAIKSLPKGLVDDVAKFLNRGQTEMQNLNESAEDLKAGDHVKMTDGSIHKVLSNEDGRFRTAPMVSKGKYGEARHTPANKMRYKVDSIKEDVEQLDELSKGTLSSYVKKAAVSSHVNLSKANRLADAAQENNDKDLANRSAKAWNKHQNRMGGIRKAADKLANEEFDLEDFLIVNEDLEIGIILDINEDSTEILFDEGVVTISSGDIMFEEVEQLDEVSKDTLRSYMSKAKDDPAFAKKKGKPSKMTVAIRAKREKGIAQAKEKLQAIVKAESDAHFKHMKKLNGKLDDHFETEAPKILKKHGFEQIHSGTHQDPYGEGKNKDITTFIKKHDNGHVTMFTLHKDHGETISSKHEARALTTKGSSYSAHRAHHGAYDEKGFDKHMVDMMPKFEQHVIKVKEDTDSPHRW